MNNNLTLISSRNNPKIKQIRAIRQRKKSHLDNLIVVEGIFSIGEAVSASKTDELGVTVEAFYFAPDLLTSQFALDLIREYSEPGIPCYATSADVFDSISEKDNPQGIVALVRRRDWQIEDLNPANFAWGIALVTPQDPGNLGTIIRTLNAVGASGLLLLDGGVDHYHPNAVRASMGAIFWHPVVRATFSEFARWAVQHGYWVYGSSAQGEVDYRQVDAYRRPAILLMGSEREGLSSEHRGICQELVRLPMVGRVTSLNLAVAAGVLLYEMVDKVD